jgi:nucleotide-binding universal stress UspA family protein
MTITETRSELAPTEEQRRIVVGFDGSDPSIKALDWAIAEAGHAPAVIDVLTAWTFPMVMGYAFTATVSEVEHIARDLVDQALTHVGECAPDVTVRGEAIDSAAGPALARACEGADMLVVGSRGHGGWHDVLLGSVSAYCARHAPCSVVIIR